MSSLVAAEAYRYRKMARLCAGHERLLDIGCARVANPYLRNPRIVGLDQRRVDPPENYAEMIVGDAADLPRPFAPASFDCVLAGELLEHLEDPIGFLRGCHATLRPRGVVVLSTPNPNSVMEQLLTITLSRRWFYAPAHVCLYPQRWLIRMLEIAGFESVELYSGGLPIPGLGLVPFPRPWCYQTIARATRR